MDFTGKVLKSMALVRPPGFRTETALRSWVNRAAEFAMTLPPKKASGAPRGGKKGGAPKS